MCATGRRGTAAEAARIGPVNLVMARPVLDGVILDLVDTFARSARRGVVETKALLSDAALRETG